MSELYKHHLYINKLFDTLVSDSIIEYDMKSAGYNLIKEFKLLEPSVIENLSTLDKKDQQIAIGKLQRVMPTLSSDLNNAFIEARKWFFEQNNLTDLDIVSIKKDALFVRKVCNQLETGNIVFQAKNTYSSYLNINRIEFYYSPKHIHVKGIGEDNYELHRPYMIDFINDFIKLLETSSDKRAIKLLQDFAYYYKSLDLDIGYYRELDAQSMYRLKETLSGETMAIKHCKDINQIDIGYNYSFFIANMVSILI